MTQIELARKEIVSDEMQFIAAREGVDSQKILEAVAAGHLVIPANVNHLKKTLEPMAIGVAVRCKINANIGNSAVTSHVEEEIEKLKVKKFKLKDIEDAGLTARELMSIEWLISDK